MLFTHETKEFGTIHTQAMINSFIPFEVIMRETTKAVMHYLTLKDMT
ncbi:MAG: hypothetical protein CM15mV10_3120 [uncultured marine virus]|nr:MAG: hypothetical protein CM15mV10_3120 [uncultured marine virus]